MSETLSKFHLWHVRRQSASIIYNSLLISIDSLQYVIPLIGLAPSILESIIQLVYYVDQNVDDERDRSAKLFKENLASKRLPHLSSSRFRCREGVIELV